MNTFIRPVYEFGINPTYIELSDKGEQTFVKSSRFLFCFFQNFLSQQPMYLHNVWISDSQLTFYVRMTLTRQQYMYM